MSYKIEVTSFFKSQAKRLAKKYPSLVSELLKLAESLETSPQQGTPIGNQCFKIRISIASKGKGKLGGGRVITHTLVQNSKVYLLSVYDKSEQEDITEKDLQKLLNLIQ